MNSSTNQGSQREIETSRLTEIASVGSVLQRSREQQSFSRQDAADELNLRLDQLDFLEHNQFDRLPGDPFVRGYIRNYAKWLGMDADQMVENYVQQSGVANEVSQSAGLAAKAPVSRVNHTGRILAAGLVVTALILGFWVYNSGDEDAADADVAADEISVDTFSGKPLEDEQPTDRAADWENPFAASAQEKNQAAASADAPQAASPVQDAQSEPAIQTQVGGTTSSGAATPSSTAPSSSAPSSTAPSSTTPRIATPRSTPSPRSAEGTTTVEPASAPSSDDSIPLATIVDSSLIDESAIVLDDDADVEADAAVDRGPASVIRGSGSDQLIFFFSDECWVQVTEASGNIMFSAMRYAGQSLILNGKAPFKLQVGNAPAVDLTLNGETIEVIARGSSNSTRLTIGESE